MIPRCPVRDGFPSWPSPRGDGRAAGIDKLTIRRNMMDTNWLEMMKDAITRADEWYEMAEGRRSYLAATLGESGRNYALASIAESLARIADALEAADDAEESAFNREVWKVND